jgi:hypothetical protein
VAVAKTTVTIVVYQYKHPAFEPRHLRTGEFPFRIAQGLNTRHELDRCNIHGRSNAKRAKIASSARERSVAVGLSKPAFYSRPT